jgi:hypothetical protein
VALRRYVRHVRGHVRAPVSRAERREDLRGRCFNAPRCSYRRRRDIEVAQDSAEFAVGALSLDERKQYLERTPCWIVTMQRRRRGHNGACGLAISLLRLVQ